jgi:hypothetical protein
MSPAPVREYIVRESSAQFFLQSYLICKSLVAIRQTAAQTLSFTRHVPIFIDLPLSPLKPDYSSPPIGI